jgi:hypothetical protein
MSSSSCKRLSYAAVLVSEWRPYHEGRAEGAEQSRNQYQQPDSAEMIGQSLRNRAQAA